MSIDVKVATKESKKSPSFTILDKIDYNIISLLIPGLENKEISKELGIPLSTIQRRTRNIIKNGLVEIKIQPNFKRIGLKKGLLQIYIRTGSIKETILEISKFDGVLSSSVHVGNSDIVAEFVYEDSEQLLDTIVKIKRLESVERVLWSEEVFTIPVDSNNIVRSFKKMWNNSPYNKNKNKNANNNSK
ncbi:MAG TPA: Lrp/AsnC family transcriptional regulator [Nitrososphaeraceae archaeon]|nr:Lrp/AsnC family transcriptional regulator [Nitrososphaeraceae archaeon]